MQVKATGCKRKNGNYQVALKSCGGTKGKTYKTVIDTNIDIIFIITENMEMYEIPKTEINNRSTLNICEKYHKYRVDFFDNGTITLKKIAKGIGPFGKK